MESSQSYIDSLYSTDDNKITEALVSIKNAVIGSNRQKENAISQGIIPRLLQLAKTIDFDHKIRLEAIIVLGSLAKGSDAHLSSILEYGTATVIMNIIYEGDKILSGAALRFMRTLAISERAPLELLSSKSAIEQLIIFASKFVKYLIFVKTRRHVTFVRNPINYPLAAFPILYKICSIFIKSNPTHFNINIIDYLSPAKFT